MITRILVEIITNDGRVVVGILKGLDQVVNVVLANTEERVFTSEGIDKQQLGLYLIRGDNVAIVGKIIRYVDDILPYRRSISTILS